jgi:hypothetical protein
MENPYAQTDSPCDNEANESLDIKKYTNAFSEYINKCQAPLSIAIQGDWGSGKTSFMKLVQNKIDEKSIESIWIDTWQYSYFENDSNLTVSVIYDLLFSIEDQLKPYQSSSSNGLKDRVLNFVKKGWECVCSLCETVKLVLSVLPVFSFFLETKIILGVLAKFTMIRKTDRIKKLRNDIDKRVKKLLDTKGKQKLVVFIDDLDRLEPEQAVKLLGSIKVFLDIPRCVFLLAMDTNVLINRLSKLSGSDISYLNDKNFIDKIIQIPFSIPCEAYNVRSYINNFIRNIFTHEEEEIIYELAINSIGRNPRSLKRAFNLFELMSVLSEGDKDYEALSSNNTFKLILFGSICMQFKYKKIFILLQNETDHSEYLLNALLTSHGIENYPDGEDYTDALKIMYDKTSTFNKKYFFKFMNSILKAFKINEQSDKTRINKKEADMFWLILSSFSLSNANDIEIEDRKQDNNIRQMLKLYMRDELNSNIKNEIENCNIGTIFSSSGITLLFDKIGPMRFGYEISMNKNNYEVNIKDIQDSNKLHRQEVYKFFKSYQDQWPSIEPFFYKDNYVLLDRTPKSSSEIFTDLEFKKYIETQLDKISPFFSKLTRDIPQKINLLQNKTNSLKQDLSKHFVPNEWIIDSTDWDTYEKWASFQLYKNNWKSYYCISMESANFFAQSPLIFGIKRNSLISKLPAEQIQRERECLLMLKGILEKDFERERIKIIGPQFESDKIFKLLSEKLATNSWYLIFMLIDTGMSTGNFFDESLTATEHHSISDIFCKLKALEPLIDKLIYNGSLI